MPYWKRWSGPLEDPLVVRYLEFVEIRARANTVLAVTSDLGIFLSSWGRARTRSRPMMC
jgi:hypothetical protein